MRADVDREKGWQQRVAVLLVAGLALNPTVSLAGAGANNGAATGVLDVQSEPAGANVYVDGRLAGRTPLQVATLEAGDHRVRLTKDGFLENARLVSVGAAETKNVHVTLTPHSGTAPAAIEQVTGGGGGSKKWLWIGLAGGGAAAAAVVLATRNSAPVAGTVAVNPSTALASSTAVTFTAQGASDPDGDTLSFTWNFGDGSTGTGSPVTKTYANAGTFNVSVEVSDGKKTATAAGSVTVRNLTGNWVGTISLSGSSVSFAMILTQTGANVSGTYADPFGPGTVAGTVSAGGAVRLVATQPGFVPTTFQGTADAAINNISGTVPTGFTGPIPNFTMRR
jgi:hypothetical protein